jgi:hypothetical protein
MRDGAMGQPGEGACPQWGSPDEVAALPTEAVNADYQQGVVGTDELPSPATLSIDDGSAEPSDSGTAEVRHDSEVVRAVSDTGEPNEERGRAGVSAVKSEPPRAYVEVIRPPQVPGAHQPPEAAAGLEDSSAQEGSGHRELVATSEETGAEDESEAGNAEESEEEKSERLEREAAYTTFRDTAHGLFEKHKAAVVWYDDAVTEQMLPIGLSGEAQMWQLERVIPGEAPAPDSKVQDISLSCSGADGIATFAYSPDGQLTVWREQSDDDEGWSDESSDWEDEDNAIEVGLLSASETNTLVGLLKRADYVLSTRANRSEGTTFDGIDYYWLDHEH